MSYSHYSDLQNPKSGKSKLPLFLSGIGAIIVVILVIIFALISTGGSVKQKKVSIKSNASTVLKTLASIPQSVFNEVGAGNSALINPPVKIASVALTEQEKPEILYMGDEWCPYCGAERWVLAVTLSRFGKISDVSLGFSSSTDAYPNTPTLSFAKVKFTSHYISFNAVEMETVNHTPLETPTREENNLMAQIGQDSIPFIDINGKWYSTTSYSPQILQGLSQQTIATDLNNPKSSVAQSIIAASNYMTSAICSVDGEVPANVCKSSGVTAANIKLGIK